MTSSREGQFIAIALSTRLMDSMGQCRSPSSQAGTETWSELDFLETSGENTVFILTSSYRTSLIRLDKPLHSHMAIICVAYVLHIRVHLIVLLEFVKKLK